MSSQDSRDMSPQRSLQEGVPAMVPVLGSGWGFPIRLEPSGAVGTDIFAWAADEKSVGQSIEIILSTTRGERAMRPDFGCNLRSLLFSPNNGTTRAAAEFEVREALLNWEPRIEVLAVEARSGENAAELLIEIGYRVRSTDNRFNLVFPFYLDRAVA